MFAPKLMYSQWTASSCVTFRTRIESALPLWLERGRMLASHPNGKWVRDILSSDGVGKCVCRCSCRGGVPEKPVPSPSVTLGKARKPCSNVPSTPSASNVRDANMLEVTFHLAALYSYHIEKIKAFFHFCWNSSIPTIFSSLKRYI